MDERAFKAQTKKLGLDVIRLVKALPSNLTTEVIGQQLIRAATSVGANYRAACRGKSPADVVAKLSIVEEEADETAYWLEVLLKAGIVSGPAFRNLLLSADRIIAMTVPSIKTMRQRLNPKTQNLKTKTSKHKSESPINGH